MPRLPPCFAAIILTFAPVFVQQRTWRHAEGLLIGAILAPGQRTVTSLLRITGLNRRRCFVNYHRVLNRAVWSSRAASRVLLGLLITAFVPTGVVVLGLDDTSAAAASASRPRASTATPCAPATAISSRPAACAG
jgi:DDE superfamily endonuclease